MEIGVYTFVERTPDPLTGEVISAEERLRNLLEEIELADAVGLDVFGVGEHHRPEYVSSSPAVVLAAAAARTRRIRLTSAVSVISSDDPVRVFQQFATVDLLSGGRAEIMAGRGSFIESFPLFGCDLREYDALFTERLELLLRIRDGETVTWDGRGRRAPIAGLGVYPRPVQNPLPLWIAVGGTPASVARAARLGLPLAVAIIGGSPRAFAGLVHDYRTAARDAGHDPDGLQVGINSHGFVADDAADAAEAFFLPLKHTMDRLGAERGWSPLTRQGYAAQIGPHGAVLVGDPEQVAARILAQHAYFGHTRFMIQFSVGTMPHERMLRAIELLGTRVAPIVREEVARRAAAG